MKRYICFNSGDKAYGVATEDLVGVSEKSPHVSYAGLPEGVSEIAYWKGNLYIVPVARFESNEKEVVYLFTRLNSASHGLDLAFKISGKISVQKYDGSFSILTLNDMQNFSRKPSHAA